MPEILRIKRRHTEEFSVPLSICPDSKGKARPQGRRAASIAVSPFWTGAVRFTDKGLCIRPGWRSLFAAGPREKFFCHWPKLVGGHGNRQAGLDRAAGISRWPDWKWFHHVKPELSGVPWQRRQCRHQFDCVALPSRRQRSDRERSWRRDPVTM